VVETGVVGADGRTLDEAIMRTIKATDDRLIGKKWPDAGQRSDFEQAYAKLAAFAAPVTARTLRFTSSDPSHFRKSAFLARDGASEATIWSRTLTVYTLIFVGVALAGNMADQVFVASKDPISGLSGYPLLLHILRVLLDTAVPFTFGGLGACTYLLRSLHDLIHKRQYDTIYNAEYMSRMLLGMVSGGAIALFVHSVKGGDATTVIQLSSAGLGFIAGYNTDFLFSAIERVAAAILPKVGIDTMQTADPKARQATVSEPPQALTDALKAFAAATDPDVRGVYKAVIDKLTAKL